MMGRKNESKKSAVRLGRDFRIMKSRTERLKLTPKNVIRQMNRIKIMPLTPLNWRYCKMRMIAPNDTAKSARCKSVKTTVNTGERHYFYSVHLSYYVFRR